MTRSLVSAVLAVAVGAAAVTAAAQTRATRKDAGSSELFAGFSYLVKDYRHTQLDQTSGGMPGWNAAYTRPSLFTEHAGLTVDLSGHYSPGGYFSPQIYFLTAGPRFQMRVGRETLFAKFVGGGMFATDEVIAQTRSYERPIFGAGGGLDIPAGRRMHWRFNFDWIHGGFETNDTNQISQIVNNNFRISSGPVWRF